MLDLFFAVEHEVAGMLRRAAYRPLPDIGLFVLKRNLSGYPAVFYLFNPAVKLAVVRMPRVALFGAPDRPRRFDIPPKGGDSRFAVDRGKDPVLGEGGSVQNPMAVGDKKLDPLFH